MSERFANILLDNVSKDIADAFGKWNKRAVWNKNYSETRRPEVPSAIIEMLSHQCFADMKYGHDPNFKFAMARSIYKSILQFISYSHKESYAVQPLAPEKFSITTKSNGKAVLRWSPCDDMREPTAKATSYNVYIATNNSGFDNGNNTKNTKYEIPLEPGVLYRFKVTACNSGGESFPTEELAALYNPKASDNILIVNGFHRLSGPAVVDNGSQQGFDLNADAGVSYGRTIGWAGVSLRSAISSDIVLYVVSFAVGLFFAWLVRALMNKLLKLERNGAFSINEAIGKTSSVYLRIPAERKGHGKVQISIRGSVHEFPAVTDGEELRTGTMVKVVSVVEDSVGSLITGAMTSPRGETPTVRVASECGFACTHHLLHLSTGTSVAPRPFHSCVPASPTEAVTEC